MIPARVRAAGDYLGLRRRRTAPPPDLPGDYGVSLARMHDREPEVGPLLPAENRALARIRIFGAVGSILILVGSLGTGAVPVLQNPISGCVCCRCRPDVDDGADAVDRRHDRPGAGLADAGALRGRAAHRGGGRRASPRTPHDAPPADRTLLVWLAPIVVAPPLLSKDIYSYLAQSAIAAKGMDPYVISPVRGLGVDHVFTRSVPNLWRDTPAPYGPLFLWLGKGITNLTGDNLSAAILLHRVVALVGVGLVVWALPRLARRCGVSPVAALWLGALNPLLILHLVGASTTRPSCSA